MKRDTQIGYSHAYWHTKLLSPPYHYVLVSARSGILSVIVPVLKRLSKPLRVGNIILDKYVDHYKIYYDNDAVRLLKHYGFDVLKDGKDIWLTYVDDSTTPVTYMQLNLRTGSFVIYVN